MIKYIFYIFTIAICIASYFIISGNVKTAEASSGEPCISFEHFLSMYKVNPYKWQWQSDHQSTYHYIVYTQPFTILYWEKNRDKRKFKRWLNKKLWDEKTSNSKNRLLRVLESVQGDINKRLEEIRCTKEEEFTRIEKERENNKRMMEIHKK